MKEYEGARCGSKKPLTKPSQKIINDGIFVDRLGIVESLNHLSGQVQQNMHLLIVLSFINLLGLSVFYWMKSRKHRKKQRDIPKRQTSTGISSNNNILNAAINTNRPTEF